MQDTGLIVRLIRDSRLLRSQRLLTASIPWTMWAGTQVVRPSFSPLTTVILTNTSLSTYNWIFPTSLWQILFHILHQIRLPVLDRNLRAGIIDMWRYSIKYRSHHRSCNCGCWSRRPILGGFDYPGTHSSSPQETHFLGSHWGNVGYC